MLSKISKLSKQNETEYNPLVSIALTTYNGEGFLRKQLDSLLAQTYSHFEIVISDDGSKPATIGILNEYARKDIRIRWSKNPLPRGFIKNTENAISLCKGEIIFLCDQDDVWYRDKLRMHVVAYQDPSVDWVYNKSVLIDENDKEIGALEDLVPDYYSKNRMSLLNYVWGSCIGGAHTSYRASLVHQSMPVQQGAPAHDMWIQLFIYPSKAVFIDKVLQGYRQHSSQEVGWGRQMSPEEFKKRENQAIEGNLHLLRCLPMNKSLALWKRFFYLGVYFAKVIRAKVRSLFGKK